MISPAGVSGFDPKLFDKAKYIAAAPSRGKRVMYHLIYPVWDYNFSPMLVFKIPGKTWCNWLHGQWATRIQHDDIEIREKFIRFVTQINLRPSSADKCLTVVFH